VDALSVVIGVLAPVVVLVMIIWGVRAIIRADRRELKSLAASDRHGDRKSGLSADAGGTPHEDLDGTPSTEPPRAGPLGDDQK
jgi:hypothetical protein